MYLKRGIISVRDRMRSTYYPGVHMYPRYVPTKQGSPYKIHRCSPFCWSIGRYGTYEQRFVGELICAHCKNVYTYRNVFALLLYYSII